jgi:hypothetical protein
MFLQTTQGLLLCVVLPLVLLVAYDLIRRKMYEKATRKDTEALLAELEALKAAQAAAQPEQPQQQYAEGYAQPQYIEEYPQQQYAGEYPQQYNQEG